ncbi:MAG: glycosyltransferase family 4 protein, partial [Bacteroidia bacterium]|nr:glycosyltransferase family 4 protein [Bacteroidia bacterium]
YIELVEIPFDFISRFYGYYVYESYRYSKRIYEHLIKDIHTFDFIYSKGFTGWYLLLNKKNFFPKIGIKLHGYEMYQYATDVKTKLQHYLLRIPAATVTKKADVVFSYGGKITELLVHTLKINREKIIELPTGIEKKLIVDHVTEWHSPLVFVFIGRYEKRKGIENLNDAIIRLLKENKHFTFHFIGDIPDELKISDSKIIYHGKITDYFQVSEILKGCDVLVCPSYSEGMPNVIVEAMANGLTVMVTDVGAISLLINEERGYLLNSNHSDDIFKMMNTILSETKETIQAKKERCLKHIRNFVWEKIADDLISHLKKFLPPR